MILNQNKLSELNEIAIPVFSEFFDRIQTELFCDIKVNAVYDSYAYSLKLHNIDSRNPIFNFHEFGIAVDFNAIKDGVTYFKNDDVEKWVKIGIPKLATELNIRWGNFRSYRDLVHFDLASRFKGTDVYDVLNKMVALAKKQFGEDLTSAQLNKTDLSSLWLKKK
jgi:hypothetical protein